MLHVLTHAVPTRRSSDPRWRLGALAFTSVAAIGGARLYLPTDLRRVMMAVLGVLLGSASSPHLVDQIGQWPWTLLGMIVFVATGGGLATLFLMRVGRLDGPTAFFSASPGGLSEMMILGPTMGGDERQIALIHATRIVMVMLILPRSEEHTAEPQSLMRI